MPLQELALSMPTRKQELEKLKADGMQCLQDLVSAKCSHEEWAAIRAVVHKLQDVERDLALETSRQL